jgi:hypothetical protein
MAPAENPMSRRWDRSAAQRHPVPRTGSRKPAATRTPTSWPTTVTAAASRVPSSHSPMPTSRAKLPIIAMAESGVTARKGPVSSVHQRPSRNDGSP